MKKGCHFDGSSNETSHHGSSSKRNYLGRDFSVDHSGGFYIEVELFLGFRNYRDQMRGTHTCRELFEKHKNEWKH